MAEEIIDLRDRIEQMRIQIENEAVEQLSKDTPLEWIYRYARQARLVDGASEVHKMVLSRFYRNERNDFWSWGL